jgi:hypothetical protein
LSLVGRPLVTFDGLVVSFNAAALKILPDAENILFMIGKHDSTICVRPCRSGEKGAFHWCSYSGKREARKGTCKKFILRLMKFTAWSFDFRYKLLGSVAQNNGTKLLKFDLISAQKAPRKNVEDERFAAVKSEEWDGKFGVSFAEHEKAVTMPIFGEDTTIIIGGNSDGNNDGEV